MLQQEFADVKEALQRQDRFAESAAVMLADMRDALQRQEHRANGGDLALRRPSPPGDAGVFMDAPFGAELAEEFRHMKEAFEKHAKAADMLVAGVQAHNDALGGATAPQRLPDVATQLASVAEAVERHGVLIERVLASAPLHAKPGNADVQTEQKEMRPQPSRLDCEDGHSPLWRGAQVAEEIARIRVAMERQEYFAE